MRTVEYKLHETATKKDIHVTATLDEKQIIHRLAVRALRSKTGKASAMGGAIKVKIDRKETP